MKNATSTESNAALMQQVADYLEARSETGETIPLKISKGIAAGARLNALEEAAEIATNYGGGKDFWAGGKDIADAIRALKTQERASKDAEDAERYRYLRTYAEHVSGLYVHWERVGVPDSSDAWVPDYTLDNAIDDAMKRAKK